MTVWKLNTEFFSFSTLRFKEKQLDFMLLPCHIYAFQSAWISSNSLLETGVISEVQVTATGLEHTRSQPWLSVCLQTKWLWARVLLLSLEATSLDYNFWAQLQVRNKCHSLFDLLSIIYFWLKGKGIELFNSTALYTVLFRFRDSKLRFGKRQKYPYNELQHFYFFHLVHHWPQQFRKHSFPEEWVLHVSL